MTAAVFVIGDFLVVELVDGRRLTLADLRHLEPHIGERPA